MTRSLLHIAGLGVALLVFGAGSVLAQESIIDTDPPIPTVDQPVTIYFNADQGTQGLKDHDGAVYAHTGVFTDQSPDTWRCVKNHWPTSDQFAGNRADTKLEQVGPDRYKLKIADIRAYYNDNETGCTLGADETVQTMNFVFRNADGSKEGKAEDGKDVIVQLGDPDAAVLTSIETPRTSLVDPLVVNTDTMLSVLAVAQAEGTLRELTLSVNGTQEATTADDTLRHDLALSQPGRKDVRVTATDDRGNTATDSVSAVRAAPTEEAAVPAGLEDGINYTSNTSVTLVLQAPRKEFVHVVGAFSDWQVRPEYQMNRETNTASTGQDSTRYWIRIDGLQPGREYGFQYLVDGELRIPDPYTEKVLSPNDQSISETTYPDLDPYPAGKASQLVSVLETGQQSFNFSSFQPPPQKDLVIYELLVRDFIEKHDYQTMQDTLAYLDRLGVNAIELMPVSEFDGNESWGYNPALYFATDKYYGPARELKRFIERAHQRGIAVILDVVYNHATGQSPFVRLFNDGTYGPPTDENPWVNREARHPFNVFYDNNHESPFTTYWLDRASEYWLTEFNVDGFRFDLSKGFTQGPGPDGYEDVGSWSSYDPERIDILQRMADQIWSVDEDAYVILEHFAESREEEELAEYETGQGRPGMMLWNNMNEAYSQASMGYDENSDLANTYYRNPGIDVPNSVTYMESHDEQWLMYKNRAFGNSNGDYDVTELETALERQKLVGAFFFAVPGPRMIWQFGELGYGYGDNGEQCLRPADCPSDAPGRTAPKPIRWDYRDPAQSPNRVRLYKTWSALLRLRNEHEVFTSPDTDVSLRVGNDVDGRRIGLQHTSMDAVVVGNFGVTAKDVTADFPTAGSWYDYFTGEAVSVESDEQDAPIPMAPGEFHIYTSEPVPAPEAGIVKYDAVAPPPTTPSDLSTTSNTEVGVILLSWTASPSSDVTGHQVYRGTTADFDTSGARLATLEAGTTTYNDSTVEQGTTYYYRIAARDDDGMRSAPTDAQSALLYPETVTVNASRSFGAGREKSDYRLVALPGTADRGLAETLAGEAGDAWQAYWDDGTAEDYLQKFDDSPTFDFAPGNGFWLISESSWSVSDQISTVPVRRSGDEQVAIIDLHQGWNIISNPLDTDVAWSRVEAVNGGTLQPLWRFDGTFSQTGTFASAKTGEAFYFHNQGGKARLQIPYAVDSGGNSQQSTEAPGALLTLTAHGPDSTISTIRVGTSTLASNGVGEEDVLAPPPQFESLSLRLRTENEHASARQRSLARSVRLAGGKGQVYNLVLRAAPGAPVRIALSGERAASGSALRLVNRQTGARYDLSAQQLVEVTPKTGTERLALITGSEAFVRKEQSRLAPKSLTLWSNYPNPFRRETTIEYTLPEAGHVRVEVYDLLGRRVSVLADEHQDAGLHRARWGGRNGNGAPAASGLYLVRITQGGTSRSQRMTLVR
jgi:1,4-alpha-glucan branching enzyme